MQVRLTEDQASALKTLSAETRLSRAELVRRAVDRLLQSPDFVEEVRRSRALAIVGKFRSGLTDISVEHDNYLAMDFLA